MVAERSSEQLRQNEALSGIDATGAPSISRTTSSHVESKYLSRSALVSLSPYPAGSSGGPPLCQAVAYTSPTLTPTSCRLFPMGGRGMRV